MNPSSGMAAQRQIERISARIKKRVSDLQFVGGGSINSTARVFLDDGSAMFCKQNSAPKFPQLLSAEASGLNLIAEQQLIRTPAVLDQWEDADDQFLLLEWIDEGIPDKAFWERFARQLAALHAQRAASFGAPSSNYMGAVPQSNREHRDWSSFFLQERLLAVGRLCLQKGLLDGARFDALSRLERHLEPVFGRVAPALLHGDLWSGNFLCAASGEPVLIDPAVYYGHPAMDLGMTTLFGGFDAAFYEAYHEVAPLSPNHKEQWQLANLYPLLIHLYLFGRSYLGGIDDTLQRFR
jgi:protein-ribulosamine 3-kinase